MSTRIQMSKPVVQAYDTDGRTPASISIAVVVTNDSDAAMGTISFNIIEYGDKYKPRILAQYESDLKCVDERGAKYRAGGLEMLDTRPYGTDIAMHQLAMAESVDLALGHDDARMGLEVAFAIACQGHRMDRDY